jgi:hypothetical protein
METIRRNLVAEAIVFRTKPSLSLSPLRNSVPYLGACAEVIAKWASPDQGSQSPLFRLIFIS